jgi:hypothetical protein
VRLALGVLLLSLLGASCANGDSTETDTDESLAGLCVARAAAASGQFTAAVAAFDHGPLHPLAAEAQKKDRRVAARLLEAKQRVEALTTDPEASAARMSEELDRLIVATQNAQKVTGTSPTTCQPKESP